MTVHSLLSTSWRRLALESLAVVASILLAFAIDAWWTQNLERKKETDLLRGLLADFQAERPALERWVSIADRMAVNNRLLIERLLERSVTGEVVVPDSLVFAAIGAPTYEASTDILDAALSSGGIELIRSLDVRRELAVWRRELLGLSDMEREVRRITNEQVVPAFLATLPLAPYFAGILPWMTAGESPAGLPGHATLRISSELAGVLALRRFRQDLATTHLTDLLASLDRLVGLLEKALATR